MFGDGLLQPSLNFKKEREVKGLLQTQDRLVISSESLNFENVTDLKLRNGRRKKMLDQRESTINKKESVLLAFDPGC